MRSEGDSFSTQLCSEEVLWMHQIPAFNLVSMNRLLQSLKSVLESHRIHHHPHQTNTIADVALSITINVSSNVLSAKDWLHDDVATGL